MPSQQTDCSPLVFGPGTCLTLEGADNCCSVWKTAGRLIKRSGKRLVIAVSAPDSLPVATPTECVLIAGGNTGSSLLVRVLAIDRHPHMVMLLAHIHPADSAYWVSPA